MTRVLLAPAAFRFSPDAGSENGWMYDLVKAMVELDPKLRFICVTESADDSDIPRVEKRVLGRRRHAELGGAVLPWRVAASTYRNGGFAAVDLVHHGLPFALGATYSVVGYAAVRRKLPFVLGPVQPPLEWSGPDEESVRIQAARSSWERAIGTAVARGAWVMAGGVVRRISDATVLRAHTVVAISHEARRLLLDRGIPDERIRIVPAPAQIPADATLRAERNDVLKVVTAGYVSTRKAVEDVVAPVARLASRGFSLSLDVIGDGPALPALRELAHRLGGDRAVRFHGWLPAHRARAVITSCDLYATMSHAESWGQAVVEALASGLAATSGTNCGALSLIELGAPIQLIGSGRAAELEARLVEWCGASTDAIRRVGAAGRRWAETTVSVPVVAQQWCEVYQAALASVQPHAATGSRRS